MKAQTLEQLHKFENDLRSLKKEIKALETSRVAKKSIRDQAHNLAVIWDEQLYPTLQNGFKLPEPLLTETSEYMKQFYILSRPNNRATSYLKVIEAVLKGYKDKFVLPVQQANVSVRGIPQLNNLLTQLSNLDETNYIKEAIDCAQSGYHRAAIVLGWCAVVDRFQRKIQALGFDKFNRASTRVKNLSTGKFGRWNKEYKISILSELQAIPDTDLIIVFEGGLELLDSNEGKRLEVLFGYRNQSAHPGNAPIAEPHLVAFFYDIIKIVFTNPKFEV